MVSIYGEVRFIDMYAMAYITKIKKTFLPDARRSSNFIKRMEKLTKTKGKYLSYAKKKVLTLTVSKQWFDIIADGEKTEEYREIKPYWIKRLTTNCEVVYDVAAETYCGKVLYRHYTHVLFINGYRKDSPRIEKEIERITIGKSKKGLVPTSGLIRNFLSLSSSSV